MTTLILTLCTLGYGVREAIAIATSRQQWAVAYALATVE